MKLLLGTRNEGKITEIQKALSDVSVMLVTPQEMGIEHDPEEHGSTYAENAVIKAEYYADASKLPAIADDSGIVVEALQGELGVQTRRWGAGKNATDQQWIEHFLHRMEHESNRRARFISTIAFVDQTDEVHLFEGVCEGSITPDLRGAYLPGLPLRSCFIPDGFEKTLSEMTLEEEKSVNHRYKSVAQLREHLSRLLS